MSQYYSRIYIKVKDVEDWSKLSKLNLNEYGFYGNPFDGHNRPVFRIDGDWSCREDEMEELVESIAELIPDCLILADTTNINVDPYDFIVHYLGNFVECDELEGEMFHETQLDDPFGWFAYAEVELSDEDKEFLRSFGFSEK